jgi:hypothetical protein
LSVAHIVGHEAPPVHLRPLHDCVPVWQLPPLHRPVVVSAPAPAVQIGGAHTVLSAYFWQPPAPLHLSFVPQLEAPWSVQNDAGAAVPAPRGVQAPGLLATLQAWQAGHDAEPQQTPSTQLPLMHWLPAVQVTPLALSAQLRVVPEPWQVNGATQSVSAVQVSRHMPEPQT